MKNSTRTVSLSLTDLRRDCLRVTTVGTRCIALLVLGEYHAGQVICLDQLLGGGIHAQIALSSSVCQRSRWYIAIKSNVARHRLIDPAMFSCQSLDLFDKWEDLVDLGAYSLALPIVDLPYAMMIVYGHLFRCLQPILTIVSALTIGDPCKVAPANETKGHGMFSVSFLVQQSTSAHRSSLNTKQRLASQKNSDHFILQQLYKVGCERSRTPSSHQRHDVLAMGTGHEQERVLCRVECELLSNAAHRSIQVRNQFHGQPIRMRFCFQSEIDSLFGQHQFLEVLRRGRESSERERRLLAAHSSHPGPLSATELAHLRSEVAIRVRD